MTFNKRYFRGGLLRILLAFFMMLPCIGVNDVSAQVSRKKGEKNVVATKNNRKNSVKGVNSKGKNAKGKNAKGGKKAVTATTSAEAKKQAEATQQEIKKTKEEIRENEKSIKKGLVELGRLEGNIATLKQEVARTDAELSALNNDISALEAEIEASEKQLGKLLESYKKSVKRLRSVKKGRSDLAFIFSSGSFSQAMRRLRYLREVSQWRERQSSRISEKVRTLREQKEELGTACLAKDAALRRQQATHSKLQGEYSRQDAIVVELKKNGSQLQAHLARKQNEVNVLRNRITQLIAAEEAAAKAKEAQRQKELREKEQREKERKEQERKLQEERRNEELQREADKSEKARIEKTKPEHPKADKTKTEKSKDDKTGDDKNSFATARSRKPRSDSKKQESAKTKESGKKTAEPTKKAEPVKKAETPKKAEPSKGKESSSAGAGSGFENMKGRLPKPVDGTFRITGKFGRHALPDLPGVMYDNPGIDVEVSRDAAVKAVFGGKVSGVYMVPGFNTVVIVSHGNYYTVYGNLARTAVKTGDVVKAGQRLGVVANDVDDSSHGSFHFEVWKNRDKQDPSLWLGK